MQDKERRAQEIRRAPLETIVEICGNGADIQPFEAEAVDVSGRGMQLRTAYLPALDSPLVCRFYHQGREILAEGVVAWRVEKARGGEFGLRFTALDKDGVDALRELCAMSDPGESIESAPDVTVAAGQRVRLHIEGLNAPMKAAVREGSQRELLVGSNLEFLRIGRRLELEEKGTTPRRGATIQGVDVSVDPSSGVPQLQVRLRFEGAECTPGPSVVDVGTGEPQPTDHAHAAEPLRGEVLEREVAAEGARLQLRLGAQIAHIAARAGRVLQLGGGRTLGLTDRAAGGVGRWARNAVTRVARTHPAKAVRRTTAPAPGGGFAQQRSRGTERLRTQRSATPRTAMPGTSVGTRASARPSGTSAKTAATGRSVDAPRGVAKLPVGRRAAFWVGLAGVVTLGILVAVRLVGEQPGVAQSTAAAKARVAAHGPGDPSMPAASVTPGAKLVAAPPGPARTRDGIVARVPLFGEVAMAPTEPVPVGGGKDGSPENDSEDEAPDETWESKGPAPANPDLVAPWGRGRLHLPTLYEIPLDAPGGGLEGKVEATGFSVFIPDRKAAGDTAAITRRDPRIAKVLTENTADGARVSFRFRDSVPAYKARLKGSAIQFLISADP